MTIDIHDALPAGFIEAPVADLAALLGGPVLFDLPGGGASSGDGARAPLFASVLLHGNEPTGLLAMQDVLRRHAGSGLKRPLLLFVGNVDAAAAGVRTLPGQLDFNRVWPGTTHPRSAVSDLLREVVDYVAARRPYASIDLHNNTGRSPPYACVNRLEGPFLQLARLFGRTMVFFEKPLGVQSAAMANVCPAVTVECGHAGDPAATARAVDFIEACLSIAALPDAMPAPTDVDLLRTFAIVKVPDGVSFAFDDGAGHEPIDIRFRADLDRLNFAELTPGTEFGTHRLGESEALTLEPEPNLIVPDYFDFSDGRIRLVEPAIPAMLTRDATAVRHDCLGYLMHRIDYGGRRLPD